MCLQSELSTELYEAKNLVFNLDNQTLGNSNLNIFWQYFTTSISVVLNSFIKNRFITKSNDRMSKSFSGQASRPYSTTKPIHICSRPVATYTYLCIRIVWLLGLNFGPCVWYSYRLRIPSVLRLLRFSACEGVAGGLGEMEDGMFVPSFMFDHSIPPDVTSRSFRRHVRPARVTWSHDFRLPTAATPNTVVVINNNFIIAWAVRRYQNSLYRRNYTQHWADNRQLSWRKEIARHPVLFAFLYR